MFLFLYVRYTQSDYVVIGNLLLKPHQGSFNTEKRNLRRLSFYSAFSPFVKIVVGDMWTNSMLIEILSFTVCISILTNLLHNLIGY